MIQQRTLAGIIDESLHIARDRFRPLAAIALVYGALPNFLFELMFWDSAEDPGDVIWVGLFLLMILGFLASIAVAQLLFDDSMGRTRVVGSALLRPISLLPRVIACSAAWYAASLIGLLLIVFPGVYIFLAWSLLPQVLAVEAVTSSDALHRSWELMRGEKIRVAGLLLAFYLPMIPMGFAAELLLAPGPVLAFAGSVITFVLALLLDTAMFLFYADVRSRREGFDLEHLARQVEVPA